MSALSVALPVITAVPLVASNVCEPVKLEPEMLVVCAFADEHAIDMVSMTAAARAVRTALSATDMAADGRTQFLRRRDPLMNSEYVIGCILCTLSAR